ncbi:hypothetical protein [Chelatococcus sp. YT9]|uniref:hypothetical protein n=1 Tax=Chelatococcus sp. YT9 TaxID=2835635 RepID=UPI001BCDA778|nr:hypothetical protein [Chelatococcus sp. YT9]MBS7698607.1 hypothetical protein [Chelatococcus sp. YT9]
MMRLAILLMTCAAIAGCGLNPEYRARQQAAATAKVDAQDDAACRRYGAVPGTDAYINCRVQVSSTREVTNAQYGAAYMANPNNAYNTGLAMVMGPRIR